MIQGDFQSVIGPKAEGFSGGKFGLGIETLHDATGELAFGAEPVEQERAVITQHPGDLLLTGSIFDRIVRVHHWSRNRPAQYGER